MRRVSTPKPCVAARASPEIFKRMRLKMGFGMKKQILRSPTPSGKCGRLGAPVAQGDNRLQGSINQKGRRSAPQLFGCYLAAGAVGSPPSSGLLLTKATVAVASPTLKRA